MGMKGVLLTIIRWASPGCLLVEPLVPWGYS